MKFLVIPIIVLFFACKPEKTDMAKKKSHPSHKYTFVNLDSVNIRYQETDYVPVYSDIYHRDGTRRFMLAATVSIRNTSLLDSAYILSAAYYDSYGMEISDFVDETVLLLPLESIEFVIDENEKVGGAGANFIIQWGATNYSNQLLIQSVMIGTSGEGISFIVDAKPIEKKELE